MTDVKEADEVVRFTLLEETGPHNTLLFSCDGCPDRKLTSLQLELHMKTVHQAKKFTVDALRAMRNRPSRAKAREN